MSLNRDDMLRELELLPVWQLREMTQAAPKVEPKAEVIPVIVETEAPQLPAALVEEVPQVTSAPAHESPELAIEEQLPDTSNARLERIKALHWEGLQDCVKSCEACGLSVTRTQTVFGVGDPNADWLIIGEAPGAEEDRKGEPFVGQAGKLLDNMLAAIQLKRGQNVYIANVLKCRPPENRDPHGEEVTQCDPFLKRQVELIQPKLIIALGKFASQSLLDTDATVASLRGRLHDYNGVPVIVTYHPAYLLRNLPDKAKAWEDLCYARETMNRLATAS
ncbi:MAG: uracil-DNA glycosylase [Methylophilaceae bacterium]|nr:uracil-DNA glycosylase [Methylophilaceae bacterium]